MLPGMIQPITILALICFITGGYFNTEDLRGKKRSQVDIVNCFSPVEVPIRKFEGQHFQMQKAVPVWVYGREREMNLTLGFRGTFQVGEDQSSALRITASSLYRVQINGQFLGYGPARAAHGFFRVDEYDLSNFTKLGENIISVEVAGYNVNSYYTLDQPAFLVAEVEVNHQVQLATGLPPGFECFQLEDRIQKVERYSWMRAFTESYILKNDFSQWKESTEIPVEALKTTNLRKVRLLPRNLPLPEFDVVRPISVCMTGDVQLLKPEQYLKNRSLTWIGPIFKGYPENELELIPSFMVQEIGNITQNSEIKPF